METNFLNIVKGGGYSVVFIAACSVVAVAVAVERAVALWGFSDRARALADAVIRSLLRGDADGAREACEASHSPAASVFLAGLAAARARPGTARGGPAVPESERVATAMDRERQLATLELRRRLVVLGTVGAIAPFIGLFGTVVGIMNAFRHMAATGQGGFAVVASGISEALIATAAGIAVAIVAVILYNAFSSHAQRLATLLRLVTEEVQEAIVEALPALRAPGEGRAPGAREA